MQRLNKSTMTAIIKSLNKNFAQRVLKIQIKLN